MKKILLLSLITLTIAISGCKKDKKAVKDEPEVTSYEAIIEKRSIWHIYDNIHKYNNANNQPVVNDSAHFATRMGTKYVFKDEKLTVGTGSAAVIYNYSFSISDGKNYIKISKESNPAEEETYQVLSADPTIMVWERPRTNITYNNQAGLSGTHRIRFHCPCAE